jgi:hypothetical protein
MLRIATAFASQSIAHLQLGDTDRWCQCAIISQRVREPNLLLQSFWPTLRFFSMSKKLTSIVLLFLVFIGFLIWGIYTLTSGFATPQRGDDAIPYGILLLICSFTALIAILKLPYKNQP